MIKHFLKIAHAKAEEAVAKSEASKPPMGRSPLRPASMACHVGSMPSPSAEIGPIPEMTTDRDMRGQCIRHGGRK